MILKNNYYVGKKFKVGNAILFGGRLNFPCKYLADLLKKPLVLPLYNRSGLNCSIVKGGKIRKGDIAYIITSLNRIKISWGK